MPWPAAVSVEARIAPLVGHPAFPGDFRRGLLGKADAAAKAVAAAAAAASLADDVGAAQAEAELNAAWAELESLREEAVRSVGRWCAAGGELMICVGRLFMSPLHCLWDWHVHTFCG